MGYSTSFEGRFELNKVLDFNTYEFLKKFAGTRRMKRKVELLPDTGFEQYGLASWGVEGEFFVDSEAAYGQDHGDSVGDYNTPPKTQPGLWCQWTPTEDRKHIEWDGGEKFYDYTEWLRYIVANILEPRGYSLNGCVFWQGEESGDFGKIIASCDGVTTSEGSRWIDEDPNCDVVQVKDFYHKTADFLFRKGLIKEEDVKSPDDVFAALTQNIY